MGRDHLCVPTVKSVSVSQNKILRNTELLTHQLTRKSSCLQAKMLHTSRKTNTEHKVVIYENNQLVSQLFSATTILYGVEEEIVGGLLGVA